MSTRRAFLLGVLGTGAAATLSGCGFRSPDAEYGQPPGSVPPQYAGRVRVVFWHSYSGRNGNVLGEIVTEFNESQDDVYVEAQYQGSYDDTARKVAASLVAGQVPDIAIFSDVTWERFYLNEALEPFDPYFRPGTGFEAGAYEPKLFDEGVLQGRSWWLPFARSTPMLYFNRDAFAQAGLPDRAPETWSELREWAPALASVQSAGRSLRSLAFVKVDGDWQFQGNVWQFGGSYSDGLDITIDAEGAVAAGEWQRRLVHEDGYGYMASSAMTDFAAGLTAMAQDSTGGLRNAMEKASFSVGAGFVPAEVAAGVATGGGGIGMMRNATAERKQAAAVFLAHLSRPEIAARWTIETGYLPVITAAQQHPALVDLIAREPNYGVAIRQLPRARQQDAIRLYGRNANVAIYTGLQQIYADNADPRDVFGSVARRLESIADEVRRQYEEKVRP
ncbi:ABC transporter substrate-binding protein [Pseudonocardia zijingensis]|uniref:ABC transporter substrate-binding protein n=1 Tax=Pseudonocardia zijingensis TaxID=153376 RepID=A0ABP3ZZ68_9PSEU